MEAARAMVTICPHRPDNLLGQPLLGHVGWGYEYPNGEWCIGAIEGTEWKGGINGFWAVKMPSLQAALTYFSRMKKNNAEYDYYKLLTVSSGVIPNPRYADRIVNWVAKQPYNLTGRNCMNSTFDILNAFSGGKYNNTNLPHPNLNWIPNGWFNAIETKEYYRLPVTKFSNLAVMDNIKQFELGGELIAPSWRAKGEEFYMIDRSNEKHIQEIKVMPPHDD